MRKIREVLRLRHEKGLSQRAVALACGMGAGTVPEYLSRAAQAGVSWPLPLELDDGALEARLFPTLPPGGGRMAPDLSWVHQEPSREIRIGDTDRTPAGSAGASSLQKVRRPVAR